LEGELKVWSPVIEKSFKKQTPEKRDQKESLYLKEPSVGNSGELKRSLVDEGERNCA